MMVLAMAETAPEYENNLWKLLAFLGRYGHQSVPALMGLSSADARSLASATAGLLKEEADAMKKGAGGG